jgi:hypothetical protein
VDLEGGERGVSVVGASPRAFGAVDRRIDELAGGVCGWEVSANLDDLADLAVQGFDRVGGGDDPFDVYRNAAAARSAVAAPMSRQQIIPAPTVSFVVSSMRMNEPVARLRA